MCGGRLSCVEVWMLAEPTAPSLIASLSTRVSVSPTADPKLVELPEPASSSLRPKHLVAGGISLFCGLTSWWMPSPATGSTHISLPFPGVSGLSCVHLGGRSPPWLQKPLLPPFLHPQCWQGHSCGCYGVCVGGR